VIRKHFCGETYVSSISIDFTLIFTGHAFFSMQEQRMPEQKKQIDLDKSLKKYIKRHESLKRDNKIFIDIKNKTITNFKLYCTFIDCTVSHHAL
jgi:hypothetical protein